MSKKHWQQHLATALPGTGRAPWSPQDLPTAVLEKLGPQTPDAEKAAVFLTATTLLFHYTKAGSRNTATAPEALAPAPDDNLPYCNKQAISLWQQIRALEGKNFIFEMRWFELCHRSSQVLAPDLLVEILTLGAQKKSAVLRPYITAVAGVRGRWLAGFFPEWAYAIEPDPQQVWQEGKPGERVEILKQVRRTDPAAGLRLLESTWEKESPGDRKRFLEVLSLDLSPVDIDFLAAIRADYAQVKGGGKGIVLEIKRLITCLLLGLPSSPLRTEWVAALQAYFIKDNGLQLVFPETEDGFLNERILHLDAGIPPEIARKTGVLGWFYALAAVIPPQIWLAASGTSVTETLNALCRFPEIASLLILASIEHNDATFAEPLLAFCSGDQWHHLLGVLPEGKRENLIMGNPQFTDQLNWTSPSLHFDWSEDFSKWVLLELYNSWIGYYFHRIQTIMPLDIYLHPGVKPASIPGTFDPSVKRERWLQVIVPELEKTLQVKAQLWR